MQTLIAPKACPNCHRLHNGYYEVCSLLCERQTGQLLRMTRKVTDDWPGDGFNRFMLQVALDDSCTIPIDGLRDLEGRFPNCPIRCYVLKNRCFRDNGLPYERLQQQLLNHAFHQHGMGRRVPSSRTDGKRRKLICAPPEVVLI